MERVDTAILWFRRDLRITDNRALASVAAQAAKVVPVYVLSNWCGSHGWTGAHRQQFLCGCLESLRDSLAEIGGRLVIRRGAPVKELERLALETKAKAIFFNRDPDPYGRKVEGELTSLGRRMGIKIVGCNDVSIHDGNELLTVAGEPFRVFTPYAKAWARLKKPSTTNRVRRIEPAEGVFSLPLPDLGTWGLASETHVPEAGEKAARRRMKMFLEKGLADYQVGRNLLGKPTSRLSQDLRFGLLSIRELLQKCEEHSSGLSAAGRRSAGKFINELVWREFYLSILWHFPEVLEVEFEPKLRGMKWPGNQDHFRKWCAGETGVPLVDAAIRQLNETGYMPNRARMIVAMFLTKDLLLDWRLGERYFMQKLTDGEIASNNGGWQWSAGTGADAAPYFRIMNPWTQAARFDPRGEYIKNWVPELRNVPAKKFGEPPAHGERLASNYPAPLVDHTTVRRRALELYERYKLETA